MLDITQMTLRLVVALLLGALMGLERSVVGKESGVRTSMLVASGASVFTMVALALPYIVSPSAELVPSIIAGSTFMNIIGNIIVGIGFIGGGIIIKSEAHVHGLTSAALVWMTAAIGILVGLGLIQFAALTTILSAGLLYLLRDLNLAHKTPE